MELRETFEPGRLASFEVDLRPILCIEVEDPDLVRLDNRECIRVASSPKPSFPSGETPGLVSYWKGEVKVVLSICLSRALMSAYLEETETGDSATFVGTRAGELVLVFGFESLL